MSYYKTLKNNKKLKEMDQFVQHGSTSTYQHCQNVALTSQKINQKLGLSIDDDILMTGALLHDFYLYDWHDLTMKDLHGLRHPEIAKENAIKYFDIPEEIQEIITSHMWPLTITKIPKSKAAWVVCLADKQVSLMETFQGMFGERKALC